MEPMNTRFKSHDSTHFEYSTENFDVCLGQQNPSADNFCIAFRKIKRKISFGF